MTMNKSNGLQNLYKETAWQMPN